MNMRPHIAADPCLTLDQAAEKLHVCGKTLGKFLRDNPQEPPPFAKPGRKYLISASDLLRVYRAMRTVLGTSRVFVEELEAADIRTTQRKEDGFVYFIQGQTTCLIKIGFAVDPAKRIRILATGSTEALALVGSIPGTRDKERELHGKFDHLRRKGEWFEPGRDLLAFIKASGKAKR